MVMLLCTILTPHTIEKTEKKKKRFMNKPVH